MTLSDLPSIVRCYKWPRIVQLILLSLSCRMLILPMKALLRLLKTF